jgi:hypothetical protein
MRARGTKGSQTRRWNRVQTVGSAEGTRRPRVFGCPLARNRAEAT